MRKQSSCCTKDCLPACALFPMTGTWVKLDGMLSFMTRCIFQAQGNPDIYIKGIVPYNWQWWFLKFLKYLVGPNLGTSQYTMQWCSTEIDFVREPSRYHGFSASFNIFLCCILSYFHLAFQGLERKVKKELLYRLITSPGNEARLPSFMLQTIEDWRREILNVCFEVQPVSLYQSLDEPV